MQKLIELDINPNILVTSTILKYNKPDYIYIPIVKNSTLLIRQKDCVSIGSPIMQIESDVVFSTVSGVVTAIKKVKTINGLVDAVEIQNDFKEKTVLESLTKRNLNYFKKDNFDKILMSNFNINLENKKNLILNCIDDEPYVLTEHFNLFSHQDNILELLDAFSKIYNFENVIICIKSLSSEHLNKLMNEIGMYPNISLNIVPNLYLLGKEIFLVEYLNTSIKESIIIKASIFNNIYNLLIRNKVITYKLITISGNGLKNPSIIKVKIGSKAIDVINNLIELNDNVLYYANGLMMGKLININNFIITKEVDAIIIMDNKELKKESKCLNCGACIDICPVNINPLFMRNKKYQEKIKEKCLKCGLCSYICPAYIDLIEDIRGDNFE